jgi:hypothetical protein
MGQPESYWVIGSGTNVGKTMFASALIAELNSNQVPTVGFKPFSGVKLLDVIEILDHPRLAAQNLLCGADGLKLSTHSLDVSEMEAEIVHPLLFVCHPDFSDIILIRSGSRVAGAVSYWRGEYSNDVLNNAQLFMNRRNLQLPTWTSFPVCKYGFLDGPDFGWENVNLCHQYLVEAKQPKVIVYEGAGSFLPLWMTSQTVNHIFYISTDTIAFFQNINLTVVKESSMVNSAIALRRILRTMIPNSSIPFPRSADPALASASAVKRFLGT